MLNLAHIVNPLVVTNPNSDLSFAQPVTLRSMKIARDSAIEKFGLQVTHYAAFYEEDRPAVPADFVATPVLDRSVLNFIEPAPTIPGRKRQPASVCHCSRKGESQEYIHRPLNSVSAHDPPVFPHDEGGIEAPSRPRA